MTMKAKITHIHNIPLLTNMALTGILGPFTFIAALVTKKEQKKEE